MRLTDAQVKRKLELERLLLKKDAPGMFYKFIPYINPSYVSQWFHKAIADHCQMILDGRIKNLMVFMPPQHGKALDIKTPILTANRGWVEHGLLCVGDYVFAPNGEKVRIEAVTCHYPCKCSKVRFADGNPIIAANQHEWGCYIPNSSHDSVYYPQIETQEIAIKIKDRSPYLKAASPLVCENKKLPTPPYLLGLWLGDGASRHKQICKSVDDCKFFLSQYSGKIVSVKGNVAYITFDELNNTKLRQIGVLGNKHIPPEYLYADIRQRISLLQGLMDTDGYCDKRGNCEIIQTNEALANDICELVRGLGYKPRMHQGNATLEGHIVSKKYRICFNPDKDDAVFLLPRKAERLQNKQTKDRSDKKKHFIKSIVPYGECIVNCIQVEGGYYLAGKELRPTHNSEIISRSFPAYALGYNPDLKIVGTSYSANLAEQFSRSIQRVIDSPEYQSIFPDTYLNGSNVRTDVRGYLRNVDIFETVGHKGFYKAVGVGGSLTGTPVDIAIIDDPVKDAMTAYSPVSRERVWDWYTSVLLTRLHNASNQLFIMTRWHEDDLAGRILKKEPDKWTVLSIPAIRESLDDGNDFDPRKVGEALWPGRHSLERLLDARNRSPRFFSALYQQHPTIEGGNIIKEQWFRHISLFDFNKKRQGEPVTFFVDTAYTEKTSNDPTGILGSCMIDNNIYIVCAKKVNMKFPELCRFLPSYVRDNGYGRGSSVRIEPKANGLSVIDQLYESTNLNVTSTPSPKDSKETRLNASSPYVESGRVWLVDGDWNDLFVDEVCGFPAKPHDEFVDLLCYSIDYHHAEGKVMSEEEILRDFL